MKKIITLITLFCITCKLNAQVDEHAHHEHLNADNPNLFLKTNCWQIASFLVPIV